jgi:serine/threonine protein kinase
MSRPSPNPEPSPQRNDRTETWHVEESTPGTLRAPTMPAALTKFTPPEPFAPQFPVAGETLEDFHLVQELGRGAMGVVFLARQVSLGRNVALKISRNIGDEARTMATLEHRHIVQVYSESVLPATNLRLLCMQFVPGVTLETIIDHVRELQHVQLDGAILLKVVDAASRGPALLDPHAVRDREQLSHSDPIETVCWLGTRLAEALAYAHRRGVLHRDIKPANVLVDQYGHPRLADFSLSARTATEDSDARESLFGGTLNYMAPEHLRAFARQIEQEEVTALADIYSLGLVLFELITLEVPGALRGSKLGPAVLVQRLLERRLEPPPSVRQLAPEASAALDRTLRRCLDPEPARRFPSGEALAEALRGCLQLRQAEKSLPPAAGMVRWCEHWPVFCIVLLALAPHIAGSVINISYNSWIIATLLSETQRAAFGPLVIVYNLLIYPLCVWGLIAKIVLPALRYRRVLREPALEKTIPLDAAREQALQWPRWGALLACLGWFPGAIYFPLGLQIFAGNVSTAATMHLVASIVLSGMIAIAYSVVGLQLVAVRVYYPMLWGHAEHFRTTAQRELEPTRSWLRTLQVLAGVIPLVGAILLVLVGPHEMSGSPYHIYQFLVVALISLGLGGFQLALAINDILFKTIAAMTGVSDATQG